MRKLCLLAGLLSASRAFACATCFGTAESHQTQGMNWGILVLLGFLGFVFTMFGVGAALLMHRMASTETAHEDLRPPKDGAPEVAR